MRDERDSEETRGTFARAIVWRAEYGDVGLPPALLLLGNDDIIALAKASLSASYSWPWRGRESV